MAGKLLKGWKQICEDLNMCPTPSKGQEFRKINRVQTMVVIMHQVKMYTDVWGAECTWIWYQARQCDCFWLTDYERGWQQKSLSVFSSSLCSSAISVEEVGTDAGRHRLCLRVTIEMWGSQSCWDLGTTYCQKGIVFTDSYLQEHLSSYQIWNCLSQCQPSSHYSYQLSAYKATYYCLFSIFLSKLWTL